MGSEGTTVTTDENHEVNSEETEIKLSDIRGPSVVPESDELAKFEDSILASSDNCPHELSDKQSDDPVLLTSHGDQKNIDLEDKKCHDDDDQKNIDLEDKKCHDDDDSSAEKKKNPDEYIILDVTEPEEIILGRNRDNEPAKVKYIPNYLTKEESDSLFQHLSTNIQWEQREGTRPDGSKYLEPRMTFWYGKPYKYSSVMWESNENWDPKLKELKVRLSNEFVGGSDDNKSKELNSVMCNRYRNNKDSIGWHADDEVSLGRYPLIASISLGSKRLFTVCRRDEYYNRRYAPKNHDLPFNGCSKLYRFHLDHGSLLLMSGSVQEDWLHSVPKDDQEMAERINLTFRHIVTEAEESEEADRRRKLRRRRQRSHTFSNFPQHSQKFQTSASHNNNRGNKHQPVHNNSQNIEQFRSDDYGGNSSKNVDNRQFSHRHHNKTDDQKALEDYARYKHLHPTKFNQNYH